MPRRESTAGSMMPEVSGREALRNLLFFALAIGIFYYISRYLGIEGLREKVGAAGAFAPLLVVLLKATTIVVVPLGGTPLYPLAGVLFGFWKGLAITLTGDAIGAAAAFYISRFFGRKLLRYLMAGSHADTVEKLIGRMSDAKNFIRARLFFAGFPELFAYAAGLTNVSFVLFLPVHILVHAVPAGIFVVFGDALVTGNFWLAMGVSIVISVLTFAGIAWFHADLKRSA